MRTTLLVVSVLALVGCARMPAPGQLVDVNGQHMHINCSGPHNGMPTVIIDAGHRAFSPMYMRLQHALSEDVRVCSYDRMGLGWSDAVSTPRESRQMAGELRELLRRADIEPPYVLAGHSLGGLIAVRYAHDYPGDIAGLALLDSSHPQQAINEAGIEASVKDYKTFRIFTRLGLTYFYIPGYIQSRIEPLPEEAREQIMYFARSPGQATKMMSTAIHEIEGLAAALAQTGEVTSLGDIPMLVITARPWLGGQEASAEYREDQKRRAQAWFELHEQYASLSPNSRHIQLEEGYHESMVSEQANANYLASEIMKLIHRKDRDAGAR